jgi:ribosomal protein S18 acetylase RimI-like enzyme
MLIRAYESSDFKRICEIGKVLDPEPPPLYYRSKIGIGKTWVVEEGGYVVGFLIATLQHWKHKDVLLPYISTVAVDQLYQRRGIATALITQCEKYFHKFNLFGLYVRTDNPARLLYQKLGYEIVEVLDQFYGKDKHGFFMVKSVCL